MCDDLSISCVSMCQYMCHMCDCKTCIYKISNIYSSTIIRLLSLLTLSLLGNVGFKELAIITFCINVPFKDISHMNTDRLKPDYRKWKDYIPFPAFWKRLYWSQKMLYIRTVRLWPWAIGTWWTVKGVDLESKEVINMWRVINIQMLTLEIALHIFTFDKGITSSYNTNSSKADKSFQWVFSFLCLYISQIDPDPEWLLICDMCSNTKWSPCHAFCNKVSHVIFG